MTKYLLLVLYLIFYTFSSLKTVKQDPDALEQNPRILINNPLLLLKLLRNFGHLIRNLGVDFHKLSAKICTGIESYLVKYCSNSLQRFTFAIRNYCFFEHLDKPFEKLIALKVKAPLDGGKRNSFQFINESNLPNLQYLYLDTYNIDQQDRIHHKNVEYLSIECSYKNDSPFSFGNLKYLELYGKIEINDTFCEFIGKLIHLQIIKLISTKSCNCSDSIDRLLNLHNISTNVEEVEFSIDVNYCKKESIETIFRFMKRSQIVRKVGFNLRLCDLRTDVWLQDISLKLSAEWKSYTIPKIRDEFSYKFRCFVLERKTNLNSMAFDEK